MSESRNTRGFPASVMSHDGKSEYTSRSDISKSAPTFPRARQDNTLVSRKAGKVGKFGIHEVFRLCWMPHVGKVGIHCVFLLSVMSSDGKSEYTIPTFPRARQENTGEPTSVQKSRKSWKSRNARGFPALLDVPCRKHRNTRGLPAACDVSVGNSEYTTYPDIPKSAPGEPRRTH